MFCRWIVSVLIARWHCGMLLLHFFAVLLLSLGKPVCGEGSEGEQGKATCGRADTDACFRAGAEARSGGCRAG